MTKFRIPHSVKSEHEELHAELVEAIHEGGEIGDAANAVAIMLHPHIVKEEKYALPPLGLLHSLANGEVTLEMAGVLELTEKLKDEMPQMLKEHKKIVSSLKILADTARKEKKMRYVHFAENLILHAQNEEEILYPAAILVGNYIKLKLKK